MSRIMSAIDVFDELIRDRIPGLPSYITRLVLTLDISGGNTAKVDVEFVPTLEEFEDNGEFRVEKRTFRLVPEEDVGSEMSLEGDY